MQYCAPELLGANGIADEAIRFNGFPYLEKEDHASNVSGTRTPICLLYVYMLTRTVHSLDCHADRNKDPDGIGDDGRGYWYCFPLCAKHELTLPNIQTLLASTDSQLFRPTRYEPSLGIFVRTELRYVLGAYLTFFPYEVIYAL